MTQLEKFIKDNRNAFDDAEPSPGHFDRFEEKLSLDSQPSIPMPAKRVWLRVAAVVILLLTAGTVILEVTGKHSHGFAFRSENAGIPAEISEAINYYDFQTNKQIAELGKLTSQNKDVQVLSSGIMNEVSQLDQATSELQKSLSADPYNEKLQSAIIRNQQMKHAILSNVITRLTSLPTIK